MLCLTCAMCVFACRRPLFVADAEYRAGKVFTRSKKGMLALYGTYLHVVDVLGLDAADGASGFAGGGADVTSCVLRWVNYMNVRHPAAALQPCQAAHKGQQVLGNAPCHVLTCHHHVPCALCAP